MDHYNTGADMYACNVCGTELHDMFALSDPNNQNLSHGALYNTKSHLYDRSVDCNHCVLEDQDKLDDCMHCIMADVLF